MWQKTNPKRCCLLSATHLPKGSRLAESQASGTEPQSLYEIEGVTGARSGAAWMQVGLDLQLQNFRSAVLKIRRVQNINSQAG